MTHRIMVMADLWPWPEKIATWNGHPLIAATYEETIEAMWCGECVHTIGLEDDDPLAAVAIYAHRGHLYVVDVDLRREVFRLNNVRTLPRHCLDNGKTMDTSERRSPAGSRSVP